VKRGAVTVETTLDAMANSVAVLYSWVPAGSNGVGMRKTTAYAEDAVSIAEYGRKQFLSSASGMTDSAAEAIRDTLLAQRSRPMSIFEVGPAPRVVDTVAVLHCMGWMATLDWEILSITASYANAASTPSGSYDIKYDLTKQWMNGELALLTTSIHVTTLQLYVKKTGTPTDKLLLDIINGANGYSFEVAGSAISTSAGWVTLTLTSPARCDLWKHEPITWQINRSGATSTSNYYTVYLDSTAQASPVTFHQTIGPPLVVLDDTHYLAHKFVVDNEVDTGCALMDILDAAQFIQSVNLDARTYVYLVGDQPGDRTMLSAAQGLMRVGASNKTTIVEVDEKRNARIYVEPTAVGGYIDKFGKLYDANMTEMPSYLPPVGKWVKLNGVLPAAVDDQFLADPTLQFVSEAQWSKSGGLRLTFRGAVQKRGVSGATEPAYKPQIRVGAPVRGGLQ
jgi:hypothetical protein